MRRIAFLLLLFLSITGCNTPGARSSSPKGVTSSTPATDPQLEAVKRSPRDAGARLALADQYIAAGETFAAREQLEIARTLGDRSEATALKLAQLDRNAGEVEAAAEILSAANSPNASNDLLSAAHQAYLSLGDFRRSAEVWKIRLPQIAALPMPLQQTIARSFLLAGDAEQAERLIPPESAAGSDPEWEALRGLAELTLNRPKNAVPSLERAASLAPQDAWNRYLLGRAWFALGDKARAADAWEKAAQLPDAPSGALIGAARLRLEKGRPEEAARLLDAVSGIDQRDPAFWLARAELSRRSGQKRPALLAQGFAANYAGDPWLAEATWRNALSGASADEAYALYDALIHSALHREDAASALQFTQEAAVRWPNDVRMQKARAEVLLLQNQLPESLAVAERLQKFAPPDQAIPIAELLCRIALDGGKPDILKQNAQTNRTLHPNDPLPLLHLAEAQYQQGRARENLEQTLALYRQAAAVAPDNAEAFARAGVVLADMKRDDEAVAALQHALALAPRVLEGTPNALLAQIDRRQGRLAEAEYEQQLYTRLRREKDDWPNQLKALRQERPAPSKSEWQALGELALKRNEEWIALCAFTRALRLSPQDPELWRLKAAALKRFGRFDEALEAMRKSVVLSGRKSGE